MFQIFQAYSRTEEINAQKRMLESTVDPRQELGPGTEGGNVISPQHPNEDESFKAATDNAFSGIANMTAEATV